MFRFLFFATPAGPAAAGFLMCITLVIVVNSLCYQLITVCLVYCVLLLLDSAGPAAAGMCIYIYIYIYT